MGHFCYICGEAIGLPSQNQKKTFKKTGRMFCSRECGSKHTGMLATQRQKGRKHSEETKKKMSEKQKGRKLSEEHVAKFRETMATEESRAKRSAIYKGRKFSDETRKKMSESRKTRIMSPEEKALRSKIMKRINMEYSGEKSANWKGGVKKKEIPLYDTFAERIKTFEEIKRDEQNNDYLSVKCTYCGDWFVPSVRSVYSRIKAINNPKNNEEMRFYCKDKNCKKECSIFKTVNAERKHNHGSSREVQSELRKIVFKRDCYACVKCGSKSNLHCHHIDPVANNPIESADVDNCITFCKKCHGKAHKIKGCRSGDLKC